MRRYWKLLLLVLVVALVTQAPFIYRRYQLGRLNATIQELNSARSADVDPLYADHKGAIHVHSFLGGHSTGTFAEITNAAQTNGLAFVVMTEHPSNDYDTRAMTLKGVRDGGVLFVQGSETSEADSDRFLTFGGAATAHTVAASPPQEHINRAKAAGQLVFIAHPETFRSWRETSGFDGMEIYNLHADAKNINRLTLFFDGLWSYRSYPHLLWTRFSESPAANLQRFDELTAPQPGSGGGRKIVAIAGNDAHANVGLSFRDLAGHAIFELKLDPYERSFHVVRTHVLIERGQPLGEENLLAALARGHAYVSFDILCDASGFRFTATNGAERKLMGDEIGLSTGVKLGVTTPVKSRLRLIRNGGVVSEETNAVRHEWTVNEAGVYRVVCYLPQLPAPLDEKPWIISNPIYVR